MAKTIEVTAEELRSEVKALFDIKLQAFDENIKHFRDKDKEKAKMFKKEKKKFQNIGYITNTLIDIYLEG